MAMEALLAALAVVESIVAMCSSAACFTTVDFRGSCCVDFGVSRCIDFGGSCWCPTDPPYHQVMKQNTAFQRNGQRLSTD